ncbi:MAG: hypothetical protein COB62_06295 [Piscirickettsiaceae bacterium]|nr:MAG: hypothetical protein COB62_06295 [Piscirickettsiaceae bacterium]
MFRHQCPHPYHKRKQRILVEKVLPLAIIIGLIVTFFMGRFSVRSIAELEVETGLLKAEVQQLTNKKSELAKQVDFLEGAQKIDQLAKNDARHALTDLHEQLSDAKERIAFYQQVVSPESIVKGVYIHSLEIIKDSEDNGFRYQLVLAKGANNKTAVKGNVTVQIKGEQAGKGLTLSLKEFAPDQESTSLSYSFRYYQILSSVIELPDGFLPEQVVVTLKPSSSKAKNVEKQWLWHNIVKNEPT